MKKLTNRDVVFVTPAQQLSKKSYYRRLWLATRNVNLSRRLLMDDIADCFRDYEGIICYLDGEPFDIPDIDETFGGDVDARWLSIYLSADTSGQRPLRKSFKLKRLQLLDLYFKIRHPEIADHFKR